MRYERKYVKLCKNAKSIIKSKLISEEKLKNSNISRSTKRSTVLESLKCGSKHQYVFLIYSSHDIYTG